MQELLINVQTHNVQKLSIFQVKSGNYRCIQQVNPHEKMEMTLPYKTSIYKTLVLISVDVTNQKEM